MIILMKSLQEEKQVDRVMGNIHDEPFVDRIIVIDGGSVDFTVQALRQYEKVEVYVHRWLHWYHDMEITQSNIALSYIPYGAMAFILDFDESLTDELKHSLTKLDEDHKNSKSRSNFVLGAVPRRTFELVRQGHYCMYDDDGWPVILNQIGQYPDFQTRLIIREKGMHWVNSPHHIMYPRNLNTVNIVGDIIHYEKDDYRDRERIEQLWLRAQSQRKKLGLIPDEFETEVKPERAKFADPNYWKDVSEC